MARRKKRTSNEINASTMADIAFLLLIFFLVTTTMDIDKGILVPLPPISEDIIEARENERNVLPVLINSMDQLLVKGELYQIRNLKARTKEFLTNWGKDPTLSDTPEDAIVSLKNDKGTSYDMYIQVHNELKAAYVEIWNEEARKKHGKLYNKLNKQQQKDIRKMYPRKLSEADPEDVEA